MPIISQLLTYNPLSELDWNSKKGRKLNCSSEEKILSPTIQTLFPPPLSIVRYGK